MCHISTHTLLPMRVHTKFRTVYYCAFVLIGLVILCRLLYFVGHDAFVFGVVHNVLVQRFEIFVKFGLIRSLIMNLPPCILFIYH